MAAGENSCSVHFQEPMFKTASENFELTWDGWIFTEDSASLEEYTDRDYSELDIPFEYEEWDDIADLPDLKMHNN